MLDLGLPDIDGVDVIHGLRGWTPVPIIVLSGRAGSRDKVDALDAGADDYVTKPFSIDELLARIRAVTRRTIPAETTPTVRIGRSLIDLAAKTVRRADDPDGGGQAGYPPDPHRMASARDPAPQPRQAHQPAAAPHRGLGAHLHHAKPTTCASTWPSSAASSNPTPPARATSSPNPAWATASSPDPPPQDPSALALASLSPAAGCLARCLTRA